MLNTIPISINERGEVRSEISILAMENENISKSLVISLPAVIADKWLYIDFKKPSGEKLQTERLTVTQMGGNGYIVYPLPIALLDEIGTLGMQVIAKDGETLVWKSFVKTFTIKTSINAGENIVANKPDVLADLQKQIDGKQAELIAGENIKIVDNVISASGSSSGGGSDPFIENGIEEVAGVVSEVTFEPYKYKIVTIGNSLSITLSDIEGYKPYQFEICTGQVSPKVTVTNAQLPLNLTFEPYTRYLFEVINNKITCKGAFENYPYKWVFGAWATSDYTKLINFKNDFTCVYTVDGTPLNGTYEINESGQYAISVNMSDGSYILFLKAYDTDYITKDGEQYNKV